MPYGCVAVVTCRIHALGSGCYIIFGILDLFSQPLDNQEGGRAEKMESINFGLLSWNGKLNKLCTRIFSPCSSNLMKVAWTWLCCASLPIEN